MKLTIRTSEQPLLGLAPASISAYLADRFFQPLGVPGALEVEMKASDSDSWQPIDWIACFLNDQPLYFWVDELANACCTAQGQVPRAMKAEAVRLWLETADDATRLRWLSLLLHDILARQPEQWAESALSDSAPEDSRQLLALGIRVPQNSAPEKDAIPSEADALEKQIVDARPDRLKLLVAPDLGAYLDAAGDQVREKLEFLREGLMTETGVLVPPVLVETDPALPAWQFSLMINHMPLAPQLTVAADRCMVNGLLSSWERKDTEGVEDIRNPAGRNTLSVVPLSQRDRLGFEQQNSWGTLEYLILAASALLRPRLDCFVDTELVRYYLDEADSTLGMSYLAEAAKALIPLETLTQLLRALVRERVSIRDWRHILDFVLDYDLLFQRLKPMFPDPQTPDAFENRLAFLRLRMKRQIAAALSLAGNTMTVYLVTPSLKEQFAANMPDATQRFLKAFIDECSYLPETANYPGVIVEPPIRARAAAALRAVFPTVMVTALEELPMDGNIMPVARLGDA